MKGMSELQPKFYERHENIRKNPDYQARYIRKKDLDKYAEDFRTVYNKAWGKIGAGKDLEKINQLFGHFKGKFGWIEKLRFILMLKRRSTRKFIGLVFGIVPEHQGKGIDSYIIVEGAKLIQKEKLYDDFEMQWIGDFNPKMITIAENLGTYKSRVLVTYRYLFDRNAEFKRHPMI